MSVTYTSTHAVHVLMYSLIKQLISSGLPQQQSLTIYHNVCQECIGLPSISKMSSKTACGGLQEFISDLWLWNPIRYGTNTCGETKLSLELFQQS